jgi:hypothetical protein
MRVIRVRSAYPVAPNSVKGSKIPHVAADAQTSGSVSL